MRHFLTTCLEMPLPSDWATFLTTCQMTSKDHYIGRCQSLNATTQVEGKMFQKEEEEEEVSKVCCGVTRRVCRK